MTKELIEDIREILIPFVKKVIIKTNYEGLGKSDAEEFEKDLNEILDLSIKALEQQPSEDCVSRQAVKTAIYSHCYATEHGLYFEGNVEHIINDLPPVTPTNGTCKDCRHREGINSDDSFCAKHGNSARDDFYCADFEKRGSENEVN